MKRFVTVFSIFLFLTFNLNIRTAIAAPIVFKQGFYTVKESPLIANSTYKINTVSSIGDSLVIVLDSNKSMQQFLHLKPNSPEYIVGPLDYGNFIIVVGGDVKFT